MGDALRGLAGIVVLGGIALACCPRDRRASISWRCVGWGVGLQLWLALLILRLPTAQALFSLANDVVVALLTHAQAGATMVFGALADPAKVGQVFGPADASIFAVQSLVPVIVFFAALMAMMYQLGVMQRVVGAIAKLMVRFMGTSGAETLSAVGNIFVGMTEAPLMIRPYLNRLTRSELLTVMIGGMCTVAGTVLAVYVGFLRHAMPDIAGHLLTASILSAPAGLAIAKLMLPETEEPETSGRVDILLARPYTNLMDALTAGAAEGLKLAANVIAMLIAMVAVVHMLNGVLAWPAKVHNATLLNQAAAAAGYAAQELPDEWPRADDAAGVDAVLEANGVTGEAREPLTFQRVAAWVFTPLAWCLGVPAQDVGLVATLLGEKTVLNEFIAYLDMANQLDARPDALTARGRVIASYALCGFANLGSVAILIGGIGALAPERRRDLAELGLLSLVGGTLAACMTGCVVGLFV